MHLNYIAKTFEYLQNIYKLLTLYTLLTFQISVNNKFMAD